MGRRVQQLAWLAWLLFLVSSVFFLASAIVARDPWAITGSLLFGMAANDAKPVVELLPEEQRLVKKGRLYFLTPIAY